MGTVVIWRRNRNYGHPPEEKKKVRDSKKKKQTRIEDEDDLDLEGLEDERIVLRRNTSDKMDQDSEDFAFKGISRVTSEDTGKY